MAGAKLKLAPAVLGAVAVLLLASGCGGKKAPSATTSAGTTTAAATTTTAPSGQALGKAAYVAKMKAIGESLSTALNTLGTATTATKAATALAQVQTDLLAAADKLHAIVPPAPVAALHAKLEQAVRDFAAELGPVITKLKAGKISALASVTTLKGLTEIQTASTAIAAKGYKIGG